MKSERSGSFPFPPGTTVASAGRVRGSVVQGCCVDTPRRVEREAGVIPSGASHSRKRAKSSVTLKGMAGIPRPHRRRSPDRQVVPHCCDGNPEAEGGGGQGKEEEPVDRLDARPRRLARKSVNPPRSHTARYRTAPFLQPIRRYSAVRVREHEDLASAPSIPAASALTFPEWSVTPVRRDGRQPGDRGLRELREDRAPSRRSNRRPPRSPPADAADR